jgi:hypothetical protein
MLDFELLRAFVAVADCAVSIAPPSGSTSAIGGSIALKALSWGRCAPILRFRCRCRGHRISSTFRNKWRFTASCALALGLTSLCGKPLGKSRRHNIRPVVGIALALGDSRVSLGAMKKRRVQLSWCGWHLSGGPRRHAAAPCRDVRRKRAHESGTVSSRPRCPGIDESTGPGNSEAR